MECHQKTPVPKTCRASLFFLQDQGIESWMLQMVFFFWMPDANADVQSTKTEKSNRTH
jgi:hypothetical protein